MIKASNSYMTCVEAAKILGFSPDHVRRLILEGHITAVKIAHTWVMTPQAIAKIKRRRQSKVKDAENGSDK